MGEIIDMQQYRLRKTAQRYLESKGVKIGTAADLLRQRRLEEGTRIHEAALAEVQRIPTIKYPGPRGNHPAGRGRHE